MSAKTYLEWQRYAALEPFDEERADLRAGIVAATIANVMTGGRKGGKMFSPADFMPLADKPKPRKRTAEDMLYQVRVLNKLMGGRVVDKRKAVA